MYFAKYPLGFVLPVAIRFLASIRPGNMERPITSGI